MRDTRHGALSAVNPALPVSSAATIYFPAFDWLRAALALIVMFFHFGSITWPPAGRLAVETFFALSGWLVGGMLLQMRRTDLLRFYFNRAVRIWGPYCLALMLLITAGLLHDHTNAKWWEFIVYKATFVYNLFGTPQLAEHKVEMPLEGTGNHFWSVNAEEQFYLLAPLLLVVLGQYFGRRIGTWLLLALTAWGTATYASIVFGVLAAMTANLYGPVHRKTWSQVLLAAVAVGAFAGLIAGIGTDALGPFFAIAVVLLLAGEGRKQTLGTVIGGMSYPLYLNHWIGIFIANKFVHDVALRGGWQHLSIMCATNLALALALYWWFDRPALKRRSVWFTNSRGKATAAIAYSLIMAGLTYGWYKTW